MEKIDLENRLIDFSVLIIDIVNEIPKTFAGTNLAGQLVRSGTSPALNYGEAQGGESRKDFIHKLKIVSKELNETKVWLEIIKRSNMLTYEKIKSIFDECDELCRIIGSSIKTTVNRRNNR